MMRYEFKMAANIYMAAIVSFVELYMTLSRREKYNTKGRMV